MAKQNYGSLFSGIPTKEELQDKIKPAADKVEKKPAIEEATVVVEKTQPTEAVKSSHNTSDSKKEAKKEPARSAQHKEKPQQNSGKFTLNKKMDNSKRTRAFYISDANYDKLAELAKDNNMAISEVLNEILTQVL